MSRALSDMMLLGLGGVLRVFAGVPKRIPARFHSLRAQGAFLVSAEKRGDEVDYVLVQSLAGSPLRLANPFSGHARLRNLTTSKTVVEGTWGLGKLSSHPPRRVKSSFWSWSAARLKRFLPKCSQVRETCG